MLNGEPTKSDVQTEDPRPVYTGRDDPAYSSPSFVSPNGDVAWGAPGLTKRELFAAMALQALIGNVQYHTYQDMVASDAAKYADALLKELAK